MGAAATRPSQRVGLHVLQDAPFEEIVERCRTAERLGFEAVHVADHCGDFRDPDGCWLDGWTVLAGLAARTERVRIGALASNPILRHPVLLAKQAIAVDRLSGGRLERGGSPPSAATAGPRTAASGRRPTRRSS